MRGPKCMGRWGLTPHHIKHRGEPGCTHTKDNIMLGCPECHNHGKYADGMPITREEAYRRIGVPWR